MTQSKTGALIRHVSFFMPQRVVDGPSNQSLRGSNRDRWFIGPKQRRFAYPDYSAAELGSRAVKKLLAETGSDASSIDLLLYSCALNDRAKTGIGPQVRKLAGLSNAIIMQVDTGCTSYLSLLKVADALLGDTRYHKAVLLTVTDFISRLDDFQLNPKSAVLGDGASASLVERGQSSIIASYEQVRGDNFGLMVCEPKKTDGVKKPFSVACPGHLQIEFSRAMLRRLREDSITSVVSAVEVAIEKSGLNKSDIDFFLSHQPNMGLIGEWRERLGFKSNQVHDTFELFGNLFQSSIPITLAHGLAHKIIKKGDMIAAGTFSNGADFVCSMVFRI